WPIVEDSTRPQAKNQGNIPLDAFRYNTQDEVNDIIGASASNTSWAFTLTDKITASCWSKKTKKEYGKYYRISSVMIPQSFNDEDTIYLINEESVSLPTMESNNLLTDIVGSGRYIIDAVGFYNLGKTACRIYMFSDDIDIYDPYSIMSYFVSLQTTSLYNNSVRDWLTLYSISYLDQYIDDDIVHEWPIKLPDPPPIINFYSVQINLSKASTELNAKSIWEWSSKKPDEKTYSQDIVLFDFGTFGATNWKQVQDNYDSFTISTNYGKIRIWGKNKEYINTVLGVNREIKIKDINNSGFNVFNYLEERDYPWSEYISGYHFKTQIIFYNEGVKLKMRVKYELFVKSGNRSGDRPNVSENMEGNFKIDIDPIAYIKLKEK
ncbi:hypothetical protein, partial [Spiroplasma phoeniceum]|uniref:hypothetical protein n=1 Tax=Spiroplasma phoeniceum TaxID=47835 RepID=UPI003364E168